LRQGATRNLLRLLGEKSAARQTINRRQTKRKG
jgi:hypothetical protein